MKQNSKNLSKFNCDFIFDFNGIFVNQETNAYQNLYNI